MKPISTKTWELLNALKANQSLWQRLLVPHDPPLWGFEEIGASGESLILPHLTPFLLHQRQDVRESAQRAVQTLVAATQSQDFVELDDHCRQEWSNGLDGSSAWTHIKPAQINSVAGDPVRAAVLGLASFHNSGYIRAEAVKQLSNIQDGSEFPFLLVRVNDWVESVRNSATQAMFARIQPENTGPFFHHLSLVLRLQICGRTQHQPLVSAIKNLLSGPTAQPLLRGGLLSEDRWLRRESARLATDSIKNAGPDLLDDLLFHFDPVVRHWAARNGLSAVKTGTLRPILAKLLRDGSVPVRCEALNILAQRFPEEANDALTGALLDRHSSVRTVARFWITTKAPTFDCASFYRENLSQPQTCRAAILGLSESGSSTDAELILPFHKTPVVSLRKDVIKSLAALNGDHHVDLFLSDLTHEHPGISNQAARALLGRSHAVSDRLLNIFRHDTHPHVRKNAFGLLRKQAVWASGIFLFEALRDRDEIIVELGRKGLRDWLKRSSSVFVAPTTAEADELRSALKASAGMFSDQELRQLEFCLKTNSQ